VKLGGRRVRLINWERGAGKLGERKVGRDMEDPIA
jgi:hypothetical protein